MSKLITFTLENGQKPTESENLEVRELWYKVPAVTKVLSATISQKKKEQLEKVAFGSRRGKSRTNPYRFPK